MAKVASNRGPGLYANMNKKKKGGTSRTKKNCTGSAKA